jgi:hypothetical protein
MLRMGRAIGLRVESIHPDGAIRLVPLFEKSAKKRSVWPLSAPPDPSLAIPTIEAPEPQLPFIMPTFTSC